MFDVWSCKAAVIDACSMVANKVRLLSTKGGAEDERGRGVSVAVLASERKCDERRRRE